MKRLKVAVVTGTRAEFGIFRPVLRAIEASRKLRLQLVVTGMHLQKEFGGTVRDISAEGFEIAAKVPMYKRGDTPGQSLARGTAGLAAAFGSLKPDMVMVLGDRLEILAAANAALACQISLAHLHGGEVAPGQWDEQIRHAVTKMAHLHFCATKKAGERILQMGEDPTSVHVVGAPALDLAMDFVNNFWRTEGRDEAVRSVLLLLHPSSADEALEERRTRMVLHSLRGQRVVVIGPNNDPGHRGILRAYERARVKVATSLPQEFFWIRLAMSDIMVGNSSSGILEAATFAIPAINLGDRQKGRERNPNVIDIPWNAGTQGIAAAIQKSRSSRFQKTLACRDNLYGDGHAAARIVRVLEAVIPPISAVKRFHDR